MTCSQCGFSNPGQFQFCGNCGQRLEGGQAHQAERRQLTVMFFDLVGSTTLSGQLDPEELRELIQLYQTTCNQVISRFQGYVAQYLGDGILAYFGYPKAHADDGRRAVSASLAILQAMAELNARLDQAARPRLDLRVGIHTGLVVVGELGSEEHREHLALGETPNVAARLQGLAGINEVVFGPPTYELVEGEFELESMGKHALKGVAEPISVYRVLGHRKRLPVRTRQSGVLVGRRAELEQLHQAWNEAVSGRGCSLQVWGQPGVGKTRLVEEWASRLEPSSCWLLHTFPRPESRAVPWSALLQMLESLLEEMPPELSPWEKILHLLGLLAPQSNGRHMASLLAQLLQIDGGSEMIVPSVSPQALRAETFEMLGQLFAAMAQKRPVLLIIDGAEWLDPSTQEWLEWSSSRRDELAMLVIWISRQASQGLQLQPLPQAESAQLVDFLLREFEVALPSRDRTWIVERAAGLPYYLSELTRMAAQQGTVEGIPARLQDFLMARLDELGAAKLTAQQAAVIGQSFSRRLLSGVAEVDIDQPLQQLCHQGVVASGGNGGELSFVQNLVREACYESLLIAVRQKYHGQVAEILTRHYSAWSQQNPGVVGHHLLRSGQPAESLPWLAQTVVRGLACCALKEVVEASLQGLKILDKLPPEHPYQGLRLKFLTMQGSAWIGLRGYAAPEVETCFEQAQVVCAMLGDSLMVFPVLAGLWAFYLAKGRLDLAEDMSCRLLRVAQFDGHEHRIACATRGQTSFFRGQFEAAADFLEQAISGYQPHQAAGQALAYLLTEPSIASTSYLAHTLLMLGQPEKAEARLHQARNWAKQLDHPHTTAHTWCFEAWYWMTAGRPQKALEVAQELQQVASRQAFPLWLAMADTFAGAGQLALGQPQGAVLLERGLSASQATGAQLGVTWMLAKLAEVQALSGQSEQALGSLDQALGLSQLYGELYFVPEILRLKAQLLEGEQAHQLLEQARQLAQAIPWFLERLKSESRH